MMHKTEHLLPNTFHGWALDSMIDEILESLSEGGGKTSRALVKNEGLTVMLMVLQKGQELKEHHASAPVMILPLRGEVVFTCDGTSNSLRASEGGMFAMGKDQPHAVQALADSAFLLVMGPLAHS